MWGLRVRHNVFNAAAQEGLEASLGFWSASAVGLGNEPLAVTSALSYIETKN